MAAAATRHRPPKPKLGTIVRDGFPALWGVPWLVENDRLVLHRVARCGTVAMGEMELTCGVCGKTEWRPLGCQDRHCPSCGVGRTEQWAQARVTELLDVPYFHFVFTVPGQLYGLFAANPTLLYGLFFAKVNETLKVYAADRRFLGGTPAFFGVLHTTNRQLGYHPHIHVVIAGAAYDEAQRKLHVVDNDTFLFPVRDLAASFRARFLTGLRDLFDAGKLDLSRPDHQALAQQDGRELLLSKLSAINWQLRTDAIEGQPERVIRYLARYIFRTAISNARLLAYDGQDVTYGWKDRKTGHRRNTTIPLMHFIRRFARHILPKGFHRVRFYGLMSPAKRNKVLPLAQEAARHQARLRGFAQAVECTLKPETLPELCCSSCGADDVQVTAIVRGTVHVRFRRFPRGIPPPRQQPPPRREAE